VDQRYWAGDELVIYAWRATPHRYPMAAVVRSAEDVAEHFDFLRSSIYAHYHYEAPSRGASEPSALDGASFLDRELAPNNSLQRTPESVIFFADAEKPPLSGAAEL
jgi:hypothetical protein